MKIIGETKHGYIVESSRDEIARLIGYYGSYSGTAACPKIGDEIQASEMFDQLYKVKGIKSSVKEIEKAAANLLEAIRIKNPVLEPIIAAIEASSK